MRLSEILKGVDVLGCTANLNQEIAGVKHPFDEKIVVKELLGELREAD